VAYDTHLSYTISINQSMTYSTEGSTITSTNNSMNANAQINLDVKAQFRGDIRRFNLAGAASMSLLKARVQALFSIPTESPVVLLYRDDENDLVTMALEEELHYAIQVSKGLLRLEVRIAGEPNPSASEDFVSRGGKPWKKMWKHHKDLHADFKFGQHHPFSHGPHPHGPHSGFPHGPHSPAHAEFHGHHGPKGHRGEGRQCDSDKDQCRGNKDKLKARHVKDVTIPDGTTVLAGVPFIKTWRVRNVGMDWPAKTRLMFISHKGDHMGGPEFVPIEGPVLADTEIDISVNLVAPKEAGDYSGFWRMATEDGKKFGQRFWVSITVAGNSSSSEDSGFEHVPAPSGYEELLQRILAMGFDDVPKRRIEHLLRKFGGNVDTVVEKLVARRALADGGKRHGCGGKKH